MKSSAFILVTLFGFISFTSTACSEPAASSRPELTKIEAVPDDYDTAPQERGAVIIEPAVEAIKEAKAQNNTVKVAEKPNQPMIVKSQPEKAKIPKTIVDVQIPITSEPAPKLAQIATDVSAEQAPTSATKQMLPETSTSPQPVEAKQLVTDSVATKHVIEITKMKFSQPKLDVRVGDQVTWINLDIVPHTATAKNKSWDSGRLKKGEEYTLTITADMTLDYFCLYHRQMKAEFNILTSE